MPLRPIVSEALPSASGSCNLTYSSTLASRDPKALRKYARQLEKAEKRAEARRMAERKAAKQRAADRAATRAALLRVAGDKSKGYAAVEAARALNELGMI